ncbi:MAG: hypothetical protein ACK5Y2_12500 [Bdellovibrionales bacterium]
MRSVVGVFFILLGQFMGWELALAQDLATSRNSENRPAQSRSTPRCRPGRDDYFEEQLNRLANVDVLESPEARTLPVALVQLPSLRNPHINPICVRAALAQVTGGPNTQNQFRFCDGEKKKS